MLKTIFHPFRENQFLTFFKGFILLFFRWEPLSHFFVQKFVSLIKLDYLPSEDIWKCPNSLWWWWCKPTLVFIFRPSVELNKKFGFGVDQTPTPPPFLTKQTKQGNKTCSLEYWK